MAVHWLVKWGAMKMFKKWRMSRIAKGKVTYGGILLVAVPLLTQWLGFEVGSEEVSTAVQGLGVLVAWAGRYRAG